MAGKTKQPARATFRFTVKLDTDKPTQRDLDELVGERGGVVVEVKGAEVVIERG